MNYTAPVLLARASSAGGISGDTIASIPLGVVNITMAAAQLLLGYLVYQTSGSK